ncbi:MAG: hypothetical protein C4524_14755 [Candidatus Zixiibacteriota bacterium]|nr:MAG: hypothetical protein C4524_14755 [candidate division Zixibacteria bacterium]
MVFHKAPAFRRICAAALCLWGAAAAQAGSFSIGNFTQVKLEYQYTDYFNYAYPSPILFEYPGHEYRQPLPYIADFPENRVLGRVSQGLGINDVLQVKYQYSQLDEATNQELFNAKYTRNVTDNTEAHVSGQVTRGTGGFLGRMIEAGGKVDFAGFTLADVSYGYYYNTVDSLPGSSDAHSLELKLRQSVSRSTALQVKYGYYFVDGDQGDFFSNTLTFWVSQYLPTKTAVHAEWRENWNGMQYRAWSPSLEVDQYLSWGTILTLRGRYYRGLPKDPVQLETITGDYFESWSLSGLLSHRLFAETTVMVKYRYYWSDEDIEMNTYLLALEHIL